jgi:hypothetical protein
MWDAIHAELAGGMTRAAEEGRGFAMKDGITSGGITYLWGDAIARQTYEHNRSVHFQ